MLPMPSMTRLEKYANLVTVILLLNVHEQAMTMQKFSLADCIGARHVNVVVDRDHMHTYIYMQFCL
jgi:hypothetical protein